MQRAAEAISLAITWPTIVLAFLVVLVWWRPAWRAVVCHWAPDSYRMTAREWFVLGVVIGFMGSKLDNFYWMWPWSASFIGSEYKTALVNFGVFPNVLDRQMAGMFSAYCHLRSAREFGVEHWAVRNLHGITVASFVGGGLFALVLEWITVGG